MNRQSLNWLILCCAVALAPACVDSQSQMCRSQADCGLCEKCEDGACVPDENCDPDDLLTALGVNTDLGPRTSHIDGEPLDEGVNPLTGKKSALGKISELFGAGIEYRSGYGRRSFLFDDAAESRTDMLAAAGNDDWTFAHPYFPHKAAVGADLDGDGREEIATAYTVVRQDGANYIVEDVKIHLIQDAAESFVESTASPLSFVGDQGSADIFCGNWGTCLDLSAGDLDGDGDDELVLVSNYNNTLYVLADNGGELSVIDMLQFSAQPQAFTILVETADLDGDGRAEIAAAISDMNRNDGVFLASYAIYAYGDAGLVELHSDYLATSGTQLEFLVNVEACDFDGDHLLELVFGGRNETQGYARLLLVEDHRGLSTTGQVEPYAFLANAPAITAGHGVMESGDFDGDGADEIFVYGLIVDLNDGVNTTLPFDPQSLTPQLVTVGDFDNAVSDGKADIAVLWADMDATSGAISEVRLSIYGAPPAGGSTIVLREDIEIFSGGLSDVIDYFFGTAVHSALAAVNVDHDTRIVEFTGDRAVLFSDPQIITVLASAPYHQGLSHAEGHTILGDSTTTGSETSHAVGANVGFSIGASVESPLWGSAGSFEAKVTVSLAADFVWGGGSQVTYTSAVENPAGQDLVVFTAVPYDAYAYRVVDSFNPDEVGEIFSLNIPRKTRVYSVEREYYNAHNGGAPDIDHTVLPHIVGDPHTYPTAVERDAMVAGSNLVFMSNDTRTCGGGGALWSLGCEWSQEHTVGFAVDVSIQSEIESVTGGLLLGISGGYHFGVETVWHWTNSTFIEGAVGDVLPGEWEAAHSFDWGVFAYNAMLPGNGRPFVVVNYWVE